MDESVKSVEWAQPGTVHGYEMLASFVTNRIKIYNTKRNDPNVKALSNLSPWFHFGQLSVQRSVLHVKRSAGTYEAKGKIVSFKKKLCRRTHIFYLLFLFQLSLNILWILRMRIQKMKRFVKKWVENCPKFLFKFADTYPQRSW